MHAQDRGAFARPVVAAVACLGAVAVVTALIFALREEMPVTAAGVLYLLPVLLASTYWGLAAGVGTAIAGAASFNFFHLPPTGQFTIADEQNWVALAAFLVAAVVTSTLSNAVRGRAVEAERGRREADLTAEMARVLLGTEDSAESLQVVGQRIAQAFELPWVAVEAVWSDSDQRRRALPIVVDGQRVGTIAVPRDTDAELVAALERRVVPSLETLLTAARRRQGLEAQVVETRALRRSNVVKTALLRSVSHDLRSPLTAITAAAGGLASPTLDGEARSELVSVIAGEAERLTRLVDNLLDLSRLQAGDLEPRRDWTSAEELIEAAIASVGLSPEHFEVVIEDELAMFEADAAQVERALANLLENAVRHAPGEPVTISAQRIANDVVIRVSDHGPGIAREELERIFEPFHTAGETGAGGTGLGLAIARGFVEANGGSLRARSLPGQGAAFAIHLPLAASAAVMGEPETA